MVMKLLLAVAIVTLAVYPTGFLHIGDKAPEFTAESTAGHKISLSDYRGKSNVVLFFYPEDMSKGCSIEACKFRDEKSVFDKANTVILGVSLNDMAKHKEFVKSDKLNFPLLVDQDTSICHAYGVPIDFHRYVGRWTFFIGKDGKIAGVYRDVDPRTHSLDLIRDIWAYNKKHH